MQQQQPSHALPKYLPRLNWDEESKRGQLRQLEEESSISQAYGTEITDKVVIRLQGPESLRLL